MVSNVLDVSKLPLPPKVGNAKELKYVSVMFNKLHPEETIRISSEAVTPMWMTKKVYTKIHIKTE